MPRKDREPSDEAQEQLADAQAQIESLETAAADAEARAQTAREELTAARTELHSAQAELADLSAQLAEAEAAQAELVEAVQDAALKYREARLAAAPHIPSDLVPGETIAEIDQQFEAAQRVVGHLREKLQEETQSARIPVGAPPRRPPDLSALSPAEKIKLGLQQREGR